MSKVSVNHGFQTLLIQWALGRDVNDNQIQQEVTQQDQQRNDFISRCLISRRNHQSVNRAIVNLFIEVANLERSQRNISRSKESLILYEFFSVILPLYFRNDEEYLYLELIEDTLASNLFQLEKERNDKQFLLYKSVDKCFSCLNDYILGSKKLEALSSEERASRSSMFLTNNTNVFIQNLNILTLIWQNNSKIFGQSVQNF